MKAYVKTLWYYDKSNGQDHDKVYVVIHDGSWMKTYWGRRGKILKSKIKESKYSLEAYKQVSSKECKGYVETRDMSIIKWVLNQINIEDKIKYSDEYGLLIKETSESTKISVQTDNVQKDIYIDENNPMPVICLKNIIGFEEGIEYYCMKYDGKIMKCQDMRGEVVMVDKNNFALKNACGKE